MGPEDQIQVIALGLAAPYTRLEQSLVEPSLERSQKSPVVCGEEGECYAEAHGDEEGIE